MENIQGYSKSPLIDVLKTMLVVKEIKEANDKFEEMFRPKRRRMYEK